MTILVDKLWHPTKRTILGLKVADELWYTTQSNGDRLTHFVSFTRVTEKDKSDVVLWQFILLGIQIVFTTA